MNLSKSQILAADEMKPIAVECPEWGGTVYVKPIDCDSRDRYEQWTQERRWPEEGDPDWSGLRARLVALALCDEDGTLHNYTDAEMLALGKKGAAMERLFRKVRDISGMSIESEEAAAKNSSDAQSENSG